MTNNNTSTESQTMNSHKAEIMSEIKNMNGREKIESRMNGEENTTVRIWIWQYLQTM